MLILTQIAPANTSPDTLVKVEPYASIAQVGETFTINITLTDVQNLYGVDVTLRWNTSILQVVDVDVRLGEEDGVLYKTIFIAENETIQEEGKYHLAGTSTEPAEPFSGSGNIVRITFIVTNVGGCKLDLEATKLADWPPPDRDPRISQPIAHTTIDGFFGRQINIFPVSPDIVAIGENVSISGFIIPVQANVEVIILYRREGETDWLTLATVSTDQNGNYQFTWQPQESGKYEIRATATIEGTTETSDSVIITVKAPGQPIWPYITVIIVIIIIIVIAAIGVYRKRIQKS